MLNTAQLLDKAKAVQGVSDYKLSFLLEVSPSAISNYRAGRSHPDDRVAERLADLANVPKEAVAVWMQIERARNDQSRALWQSVASSLQRAGVAAAVILSLGFWTGGPDGGALASEAQPSQAASAGPLCIM